MDSKSDQQGNIEERILAAKQEIQLQERYKEKAKEFTQLSRKSFIIRKTSPFQKEDNFGKEIKYLTKSIEEKKKNEELVQNLDITDSRKIKYLIQGNIELLTCLFLDTASLLMIYPFNTIKTRIQANHKFEDVSFFRQNKVAQAPLYQGISQGMMSLLFGTILHQSTFKLIFQDLNSKEDTSGWSTLQQELIALTLADIVSIPLRLPFEVRKTLIQMNIQPADQQQYFRSMKNAILPTFLRDLIFRFTYNASMNLYIYLPIYQKLFEQDDPQLRDALQKILDKKSSFVSSQTQINAIIGCTLLGLVLTNPFDVVFSKYTTQQYNQYTGVLNCLKTVYREQGILKLFFSGFWPRSFHFLINGTIAFNFFDKTQFIMQDAFDDN